LRECCFFFFFLDLGVAGVEDPGEEAVAVEETVAEGALRSIVL
jgi:hypothetical protein